MHEVVIFYGPADALCQHDGPPFAQITQEQRKCIVIVPAQNRIPPRHGADKLHHLTQHRIARVPPVRFVYLREVVNGEYHQRQVLVLFPGLDEIFIDPNEHGLPRIDTGQGVAGCLRPAQTGDFGRNVRFVAELQYVLPTDVNLVAVAKRVPRDLLAVDVRAVSAAQILDENLAVGTDNDAGVALADAPVLNADIGFR